jgi:hypothetical protein
MTSIPPGAGWIRSVLLALLPAMAGCSSIGPGTVSRDRLNRSGFDDLQTADVAKLAGVERGDGPTALQGGCCDNQVVGANHLAGGAELGPDSPLTPRVLEGFKRLATLAHCRCEITSVFSGQISFGKIVRQLMAIAARPQGGHKQSPRNTEFDDSKGLLPGIDPADTFIEIPGSFRHTQRLLGGTLTCALLLWQEHRLGHRLKTGHSATSSFCLLAGASGKIVRLRHSG